MGGTNPIWEGDYLTEYEIACLNTDYIYLLLMDEDDVGDDDVISYTRMKVMDLASENQYKTDDHPLYYNSSVEGTLIDFKPLT